MPLLTLSLAQTGINDQGFVNFVKKMEEVKQRFEPSGAFGVKDYYRGGMAINFS